MTELVQHQTTAELTMADQWKFAQAVSDPEARGQSILPDAYRGNPANVMIAVGLGQSMGLSPAESLYRISVIKGKPSAGAELIAANVRRAGHKLRVHVTENPPSATAQIVRADDPDFPFEVTRDMDWAKQMGLASNDNYKKQASTMLQWRAITAVARLACPEALYGVTYTPDEIRDGSSFEAPAPTPRATAAQFAPTDPAHTQEPGDVITDRTRKEMFALFTQKGADTREKQMKAISHYAGVEPESRGDLTEQQAAAVIAGLRTLADTPPEQEPAPEEGS